MNLSKFLFHLSNRWRECLDSEELLSSKNVVIYYLYTLLTVSFTVKCYFLSDTPCLSSGVKYPPILNIIRNYVPNLNGAITPYFFRKTRPCLYLCPYIFSTSTGIHWLKVLPRVTLRGTHVYYVEDLFLNPIDPLSTEVLLSSVPKSHLQKRKPFELRLVTQIDNGFHHTNHHHHRSRRWSVQNIHNWIN